MKKASLWEAMEHIDPLMIEEADRPVPRRRRPLSRALVIAAAACLLLAMGVLAAEELFGFRILEVRNDDHGARHSLTAEDVVYFPAEQFGGTVQERLAAGGDPTTVIEEHPANENGIVSARIQIDVPYFDTYAEAAAYAGEDIPLAPESTVLSGHSSQQFSVATHSNVVLLSAVYDLEETGVMFSATIAVEGGPAPSFGAYYGTGQTELQQEAAETGTGCPALIYRTAGEHSTCEAYFIREGIVYNIFLTDTDDLAILQQILDTY